MALSLLSQHRSFDGEQSFYSHKSLVTGCTMHFGIYLPPNARTQKLSTLYWLSGLTCTEQNFFIKSGVQRIASKLNMMIVAPDTSPRGEGIPDDPENDSLGIGAGFYLDATVSPWQKNYQMYSYITQELTSLIAEHFPIDENQVCISGHSMGGYGALSIALKNPSYFKSVSAFSPICSLKQSPWGQKAITEYLGGDKHEAEKYDVLSLLIEKGWKGPEILIDQGTEDVFLNTQLKPELLLTTCEQESIPLKLNMRENYDHSYYFVASFIEKHLRYHKNNLWSY